MRALDHHHDDELDRGLAYDLTTMLSRRRLLSFAAGIGATAALAACGSDDTDDAASQTTAESSETAGRSASTETSGTSGTTASSASCEPIPEETAGPFPGDGSNGPDALSEADVVRSDIRSSIGSASGVADGVPLSIDLTLTDTESGCAPLADAAVYVWHCDREGRYSMYSPGAEGENYLRGVQVADTNGRLTFASIFPACYSGRWPHIHFEVYQSVDAATSGDEPIATSQLALPEDVCTTVYATEGYEDSVGNLAGVSLDGDNVFSEDGAEQLASVTGDAGSGYVAALTIPV